jgi:hypothetical protein
VELRPRIDAKLVEDLVEVVFDSARADKQSSAKRSGGASVANPNAARNASR